MMLHNSEIHIILIKQHLDSIIQNKTKSTQIISHGPYLSSYLDFIFEAVGFSLYAMSMITIVGLLSFV